MDERKPLSMFKVLSLKITLVFLEVTSKALRDESAQEPCYGTYNHSGSHD